MKAGTHLWRTVAVSTVLSLCGLNAAMAKKPDNSGGGDGSDPGFKSATIRFETFNLYAGTTTQVTSDDGTDYEDGLQRIMAQVGDGSRLDTTDGSMKVIDRNMIRWVKFDLSGFPATGMNGLTRPDDGDGDAVVFAGVDTQVDREIVNGIRQAVKPGLLAMQPGTTKWSGYFFTFAFVNGDGIEERWKLSYGEVGGLPPYGTPIRITAGAGTTEFANSWTIQGTRAGLTQIKVGNREDPKFYGEANISFEITITAQ